MLKPMKPMMLLPTTTTTVPKLLKLRLKMMTHPPMGLKKRRRQTRYVLHQCLRSNLDALAVPYASTLSGMWPSCT